ncbi:MAG: hypothetical protein ACFBSG_02850 [Leptolyngbyaceae cyanobacterium]
MPNTETLEKQTPQEPVPAKVATRKWRWQMLIAPLMGISVALHIALLFVPLPTPDEAEEAETEEEVEEEEEAPVDILTPSELPAPEPPPEEPPPEQPQPSQPETPAPPAEVPPPPDPEQVQPAPDPAPEEDVFPEEDDFPEEQGGGSFDPARQSALAGGGRQNLGSTEFGSLNQGDPGLIAAYIDQDGLKGGVDPGCFFAEIDPSPDTGGLTPVNGVIDTVVVTQNIDYVPEVLCNSGYCTSQALVGEFCGARLYELQDNGVPQLYASLMEPGGDRGGGAVVVALWTSDPR